MYFLLGFLCGVERSPLVNLFISLDFIIRLISEDCSAGISQI